MNKKKIAIFVSGSGTNMENIAKYVKAGALDCKIALVVCDKPEAKAIERAAYYGIDTFVVNRKNFDSKSDFESAIDAELERKAVDLICLAGYMRIIGSEFVRKWKGRLINVHPSLLPKFPGAHSIEDAFEAGVRETGVTIHFVDEGVDTGPKILSKVVAVQPSDTLEALETKVHEAEYEIYPKAIQLYLEGRVKLSGNRVEISEQL